MSKEKLTPNNKSVPSSGGVKESSHSTLSTPKQLDDGKVPWGKDSKDRII